MFPSCFVLFCFSDVIETSNMTRVINGHCIASDSYNVGIVFCRPSLYKYIYIYIFFFFAFSVHFDAGKSKEINKKLINTAIVPKRGPCRGGAVSCIMDKCQIDRHQPVMASVHHTLTIYEISFLCMSNSHQSIISKFD